MDGPVDKEVKFSLHNNENYKKELDCETCDAVNKISTLFIDYFKFIKENINLKKTPFSRFIIIRGLDTIINVFNYILFFTKNIDLTYFHCQKAFYFYVEFVSQISADDKMFLQLSSRDATTYVYKKTIFEINNLGKHYDISDTMRLKLNSIHSYLQMYKSILLKLINNDFLSNEKTMLVENIYNSFNVLKKIKITELNKSIEKLYYIVECDEYFLNACLLIAKKIDKNTDFFHKFSSEDFNEKLQETPDKFINWLMK
jgi:hypothetical protein